jgi:deferrochelatase/peroxidase EfeB
MTRTGDGHDPAAQPHRGLSRRSLLSLAGLGAAGVGAGVAVGVTEAMASDSGPVDPNELLVAFHGRHQAGIATAVQSNLHFASFDVTASDRAALVGLLKDWTSAARDLTAGRRVGGPGLPPGGRLAPPTDTGEARGLPASRLTLTVGFGPSLFDDRYGLQALRPQPLVDLPKFPGDALDPARSGGDLCVQACADDPQVAVHAIRNLSRIAAGRAAVRWAQLGFGKASSTDTTGPTPRNLFGFKDGTANVLGNDSAALDKHVWAATDDDEAAHWMAGGSYLVSRRIRMTVETWDRGSLDDQELIIGRTKRVGAPLGEKNERDPIHPSRLPADSHVALAHPSHFDGARLLRRGFNFVDGADGFGHLDAGLFFLAYQRDPRKAFVPIQLALARGDAMNEYVRHTGSAIWACPPGVRSNGWWGETLFASP